MLALPESPRVLSLPQRPQPLLVPVELLAQLLPQEPRHLPLAIPKTIFPPERENVKHWVKSLFQTINPLD